MVSSSPVTSFTSPYPAIFFKKSPYPVRVTMVFASKILAIDLTSMQQLAVLDTFGSQEVVIVWIISEIAITVKALFKDFQVLESVSFSQLVRVAVPVLSAMTISLTTRMTTPFSGTFSFVKGCLDSHDIPERCKGSHSNSTKSYSHT